MSYIPESAIAKIQRTKQRILLKNRSVIQFVGSDSNTKLRGTGIKGAVISEYSYHKPEFMTSVIEPMVVRSNAWLLYLYTPSEDPKLTHGEELYLKHKDDPQSYCEIKTIDDTTDCEGKPLVNQDNLKSMSMTFEKIRREFYCDFEAYKYKRAEAGRTFVKAEKDEAGNINISWICRNRTDGDWREYIDIAIDEESEKYEIDIKKKRTLIRTLTSNIATVTYTKEQITNDFTNLPTGMS